MVPTKELLAGASKTSTHLKNKCCFRKSNLCLRDMNYRLAEQQREGQRKSRRRFESCSECPLSRSFKPLIFYISLESCRKYGQDKKNSIIVRTGINSLRQHLSPTTGPRVVSTVLADTEVVEGWMRKKKREKAGTIF